MIRLATLVGYVAAYLMTPLADAAPKKMTVAPHANCFDLAASTYRVDSALLSAIAMAESSMRPRANNFDHKQRTGTYDIGLMQINSGWLPALKRFNISEQALYDPCTNISVGAWILRRLIDKNGETWNSVGAYNAACTQLKGAACEAARTKYIRRVHRFLSSNSAPAAATPSPPSSPPAAAPKRAQTPFVSAPSELEADPIDLWSHTLDVGLSEVAEKPTHP